MRRAPGRAGWRTGGTGRNAGLTGGGVAGRIGVFHMAEHPWVRKGRLVLDMEAGALKAVRRRLGKEFVEAVRLMREALEAGRKLVATGIGKSGHIAEKLAATLTSTGAPCVYLNCVNAVHGDLGIVSEGDTVLALSYSGETEELVRTLPSLKRPGVRVIGITGRPKSTLAKNVDVHLNVAVSREACPLNLAPTSSTTAMLALGDALAMVLLEARGVTKETFAKFHPGGAIGKSLLLRVQDVMRSGGELATVREGETVMDAVRAMSRAKAGAACVVLQSGRLAGIFTHGDFARCYQRDESVGRAAVGGVMTRRPVTVGAEALAVDALRIFEKHQIDDLVVVDRQGRPVGVVDAQDLAKHKLV